jgi:AraC-like DNA-binding protein
MLPNGQRRIRAVQFTYHGGQVVAEHVHLEHQLVYASEGLLTVDTASSRWVVPPLRAVWVPAHTPHTVVAKVDTKMSTLYINADTHLPNLDRVTVVSVSPLLRELILHIIHAPLTETAHDRVEAVLLDQLAADPAAPLEVPVLRDPRLQAIADAFERDPCDRRTLRELGVDVGASERTLQRLFQTEIGSSFGRWRTQLRLQHGVIELGKGRSVTSAASRSGYSEASAFIEAFRSAFGTTPGRYFSQDTELSRSE